MACEGDIIVVLVFFPFSLKHYLYPNGTAHIRHYNGEHKNMCIYRGFKSNVTVVRLLTHHVEVMALYLGIKSNMFLTKQTFHGSYMQHSFVCS